MKKKIIFLGIALAMGGCSPNGKSAWQDVIRHCASSDLNGKHVLYFGPSNAIGPGSIWRKDTQGEFRLRYDLAQMPPPSQDYRANFTETTCDGTWSSGFNLGATASIAATAASADLQADFKKAKKVSAKANSVAWVPIA